MAGTTLADIIVPELFNPYVINRTMEKSALFQSGIITTSPEFSRLASEAARTHNMPFFEDLTGDAQNIVEGEEIEFQKITIATQSSHILTCGFCIEYVWFHSALPLAV